MSFTKLLLSPTILVALLLTAAAIWLVGEHVPHHSNPSPFTQLYMHLMPEPLLENAHAEQAAEGEHAPEYLVSLPLPAFLASFPGVQAGTGHGPAHFVAMTNLQVFQIAAVLLVLWCFLGVAKCIRTGQGDAITKVLAGFADYVRKDMVLPAMGKHGGEKFTPYFLCLFFFILFMNLLGLVPGGASATASIFVTGALAFTTLVAMLVGGMVVQGPLAFWRNLVPHVPLVMWPLMFGVELTGLLVKPASLTIRLFANMLGGHLVVLSFMGLIFYFAAHNGAIVGWSVAPIWAGFGVFIMIIESFVALLQAFIFTQLSILFLQAALHPEH